MQAKVGSGLAEGVVDYLGSMVVSLEERGVSKTYGRGSTTARPVMLTIRTVLNLARLMRTSLTGRNNRSRSEAVSSGTQVPLPALWIVFQMVSQTLFGA